VRVVWLVWIHGAATAGPAGRAEGPGPGAN